MPQQCSQVLPPSRSLIKRPRQTQQPSPQGEEAPVLALQLQTERSRLPACHPCPFSKLTGVGQGPRPVGPRMSLCGLATSYMGAFPAPCGPFRGLHGASPGALQAARHFGLLREEVPAPRVPCDRRCMRPPPPGGSPCQRELLQAPAAFALGLRHVQAEAVTALEGCRQLVGGTGEVLLPDGVPLLDSVRLRQRERGGPRP